MGKMKEIFIELMQEEDFDDIEYFIWHGESEDMTMPEYMKASGDTIYNVSGETPVLLDFDFKK